VTRLRVQYPCSAIYTLQGCSTRTSRRATLFTFHYRISAVVCNFRTHFRYKRNFVDVGDWSYVQYIYNSFAFTQEQCRTRGIPSLSPFLVPLCRWVRCLPSSPNQDQGLWSRSDVTQVIHTAFGMFCILHIPDRMLGLSLRRSCVSSRES